MAGEEMLPFGERLRQLRRAAGLSQEALAERAGLTAKGLAALERGRRQRPYLHTIQALADALDLSNDERAVFIASVPDRQPMPDSARVRLELLPVPPDAIIGREREVAEIVDLFRSQMARTVTLTGPGGVGKTRLALEVARHLGTNFSDGVVFVALAAIEDATLVLPSIANAIGVGDAGGDAVDKLLAHTIGQRRLLLVLDNVEQVLDVAPKLASLVEACPHLALLVTSRAPLRIRAERKYPVSPLELPDLNHVPTPGEVARSSSAQLFMQRARASVPTFTLTQANCTTIAAICRRLDGLPLALELAAPRIQILDATSLLARLDRSLSLLADGSRDLPARQQTLRATIGWSYEMLGPGEQTLFRHLSVFAGGWTLEAAEHVVRLDDDQCDVLSAMSRLVDHHLVEVIERDGSNRFGMLETIREFAAELLAEHGEENEARRRHTALFLEMAERFSPEIWSTDVAARVSALEREQDNLRAALRWAFDHGDAETAVRLAGTLQVFWWAANSFHEGRAWLEQAITWRDEVPAVARARALVAAAVLELRLDSRDRAMTWLDEALQLYRELGDEHGMATVTYHQGHAQSIDGDVPAAICHFEDSKARFERTGNDVMAAAALNHLGDLWQRAGDIDRAQAVQVDALARARSIGHPPLLASVLHALGRLAHARGEYHLAGAYFLEHLGIEWIARDGVGVSDILTALGQWLVDVGEPALAARFLGAAEALVVNWGLGPTRMYQVGYDTALLAIRTRLGTEAFTAAWDGGHRLSLDEVISEARQVVARRVTSGDFGE